MITKWPDRGRAEKQLGVSCQFRVWHIQSKEMGNTPARYVFEGYSHEMVGYAIRKLHDVRLIQARDKSVWTRDQLRCWPLGFKGRGLEFLAAAKEEDAWQEALKILEEREITPTIKMLAHYLLGVVQKESV